MTYHYTQNVRQGLMGLKHLFAAACLALVSKFCHLPNHSRFRRFFLSWNLNMNIRVGFNKQISYRSFQAAPQMISKCTQMSYCDVINTWATSYCDRLFCHCFYGHIHHQNGVASQDVSVCQIIVAGVIIGSSFSLLNRYWPFLRCWLSWIVMEYITALVRRASAT